MVYPMDISVLVGFPFKKNKIHDHLLSSFLQLTPLYWRIAWLVTTHFFLMTETLSIDLNNEDTAIMIINWDGLSCLSKAWLNLKRMSGLGYKCDRRVSNTRYSAFKSAISSCCWPTSLAFFFFSSFNSFATIHYICSPTVALSSLFSCSPLGQFFSVDGLTYFH
jgi:hypothetical protein